MSQASSSATAMQPERFRELVGAVQDYGIFMLDPAGTVLSWNLGASKLKGYDADEVIGRHFSMFYPDTAKRSGWPDHELRVAAEKGKYEEEGWRVRKDGSMFWANVVITALHDDSGKLTGFGKVTRDLTLKHENEEALRQSEERFRLLVEGVRDYAIYMLDPQGVIQSWNGGAQLIKGYAHDEVIGKHYSMFFREEDKEAGLPAKELNDALTQGRTEDEGWRLRKDGSSFWANVVMTPITTPSRDLLGFAKVTRDMTERSRMRELENSSRRTNGFLGMLAQELHNPVAPIHSALSILRSNVEQSASIETSCDLIERQLARVTRLVDELLDANELGSGHIQITPETVSFNAAAARAIDAIRPDMEARSHDFNLQLPPGDVWLIADEARLEQILRHLLDNATRYTPQGGTIKLAAKARDGRLLVEISDDGAAQADFEDSLDLIPEEDVLSVSRQSGLAIGLSLARSLIEMHGGSISAFSKGAGRGGAFRFELPGVLVSG